MPAVAELKDSEYMAVLKELVELDDNKFDFNFCSIINT